jgi:NADH-quinone oxidoreductase subunit C
VADRVEQMSEQENTFQNPIIEAKPVDELVKRVMALNLGASVYDGSSNIPAVQVDAKNLVAMMTELRNNEEFKFNFLSSHTAVDRIEQGVFQLMYYLHSLIFQKHLLVSVVISRENPVAPSLCGIWRTAEWQEREVYDLFGVKYDNHPDLRRVFLEDEWTGFPLRKDYKDDFMLTKETKEE